VRLCFEFCWRNPPPPQGRLPGALGFPRSGLGFVANCVAQRTFRDLQDATDVWQRRNPPPGPTNPCSHSVFGSPQTQSRLLLDAETTWLECDPPIMPSTSAIRLVVGRGSNSARRATRIRSTGALGLGLVSLWYHGGEEKLMRWQTS